MPVSKIIMTLAYGDEWTNMLQPFWAFPLLGITGLKAKEIVPFTLPIGFGICNHILTDYKSIVYMVAIDGTLFWREIYGYSNYCYDTDIHSSGFGY